MSKKRDALKEVQGKMAKLPRDSPLRQKNQDVIHAAQATLEFPEQAPAAVQTEHTPDAKAVAALAPSLGEPQVDADNEKHAAGKSEKPHGKQRGARKCNQRNVGGG